MAVEGSRRSKWNLILAVLVASGLALASAWVAFGPGPRHCSASFSLPFIASSRTSGEAMCRGAFGYGTVLASAILLLMVAAAIRLRSPGRIPDGLEKAGQWLAVAALAPLLLLMLLFAAPVWIGKWAAGRILRRRHRD